MPGQFSAFQREEFRLRDNSLQRVKIQTFHRIFQDALAPKFVPRMWREHAKISKQFSVGELEEVSGRGIHSIGVEVGTVLFNDEHSLTQSEDGVELVYGEF